MAIAGGLGPVGAFLGKVYGRIFEKPFRVCGEVAAAGGLCAAIWSGYTNWMNEPAKKFLVSNGYSVNSKGIALSIFRRDAPALERFRDIGIDPPSSAVLCTNYDSIETLQFMVNNGLVEKKGQCGSSTDKSIDSNAIKELCEIGVEYCQLDSEKNLKNIKIISNICKGINCPLLDKMDVDVKERYGGSFSRKIAFTISQKDKFIYNCMNSNEITQDDELSKWFYLEPAPRRSLFDYDQRPLHRDEIEPCTGAPFFPGTDMLDYPGKPYGVAYCVAIDEKERAEICEARWSASRARISNAQILYRRWTEARGINLD